MTQKPTRIAAELKKVGSRLWCYVALIYAAAAAICILTLALGRLLKAF